jgi:hypothetical protein
MAAHHSQPGWTFDPSLVLAMERMQVRHQEAHAERLAARSTLAGSTPLRVRLGNALIALGSSLATPGATHQPSLTD